MARQHISPEITVNGFKKCCMSSTVDGTDDDMLWNGSGEDGNVRSECENGSEEDGNSEINPTRCNNCIYSSQWLYSTCFGRQLHPSSGVKCCIWPFR